MILKKIEVLSLGYALAIIEGIFGFFYGILMIIQLNTPSLISHIDDMALTILSRFNFWLILLCPAFMLVFGFVMGVILATFYNAIVVKITGGIRLKLEQ